MLLNSGIFATVITLGIKQAVLELSPGLELTVLKQAIARKALPSDEDELTQDDDEVDDLDDVVEPIHAEPVHAEPIQAEPGQGATALPEQPRSAGADSRLS